MNTFKFPPLSFPNLKRLGLIGVFNPKKGCKTSTMVLLANQFRDLRYDLSIWQHDRHGRFKPYGANNMIELALATDVFNGDSSANLQRHEGLTEELARLDTTPNRIIALDSSGPAAGMMAPIFNMGRYNRLLLKQECHGALFVPFRLSLDVAEGALEMIKELRPVMRDHFIVPVPIFKSSDLAYLDRKHPLFQIVGEAEHGVMCLPEISAVAASGLDRVHHPMSEIANPDNDDAIEIIRAATGYGRLEAGAVASSAASLVAAVDRALAPVGFMPGA
jgi:hypothetical protein